MAPGFAADYSKMRALQLDQPPNSKWTTSLDVGIRNAVSYVQHRYSGRTCPALTSHDFYQQGYLIMCQYPTMAYQYLWKHLARWGTQRDYTGQTVNSMRCSERQSPCHSREVDHWDVLRRCPVDAKIVDAIHCKEILQQLRVIALPAMQRKVLEQIIQYKGDLDGRSAAKELGITYAAWRQERYLMRLALRKHFVERGEIVC